MIARSALLRFTRRDGGARIAVQREGQWVVALAHLPAVDIAHELAHVAVEAATGRAGFATLLAEGTPAELAREVADADALVVEALVQVVAAPSSTPIAVAMSAACARWGVPPPAVAEADVWAMRARYRELSERWEALPAGGSLDVALPLRPRLRRVIRGERRSRP